MTHDLTLPLVVAAAALNGILTGASLDQSIKQLPARHRIGAVAYATYSRASDLGMGIAWYAAIGVSAAVVTVAAAVVAVAGNIGSSRGVPLVIAGVLSVLHSLATSRAAPTLFSQRRMTDEASLTAVFDRFTRWQAVRVCLQVLTFVATLWALVAFTR